MRILSKIFVGLALLALPFVSWGLHSGVDGGGIIIVIDGVAMEVMIAEQDPVWVMERADYVKTNHTAGNITIHGHILPGADNTYDIGEVGNQWRSGYFAVGTLFLGSNAITIINDTLATVDTNGVTNLVVYDTNPGISTNLSDYNDDIGLVKISDFNQFATSNRFDGVVVIGAHPDFQAANWLGGADLVVTDVTGGGSAELLIEDPNNFGASLHFRQPLAGFTNQFTWTLNGDGGSAGDGVLDLWFTSDAATFEQLITISTKD